MHNRAAKEARNLVNYQVSIQALEWSRGVAWGRWYQSSSAQQFFLFWNQAFRQVYDRVDDQVFDQVFDQVEDQIQEEINESKRGNG